MVPWGRGNLNNRVLCKSASGVFWLPRLLGLSGTYQWIPGSPGSPASQRGRGGQECTELAPAWTPDPGLSSSRPVGSSPRAPQSQPRGSIEGTGRGKGILSGETSSLGTPAFKLTGGRHPPHLTHTQAHPHPTSLLETAGPFQPGSVALRVSSIPPGWSH